MSKQIDLQKMMKTAVKKALKEDIEPAVKEVYKKHAETLKDIKPGKNAEEVTNAAAKKAQKKTAKHIARRMSDEKYIVSSDKYLAPEFKDTGAFSVYNDKPLETLMGWQDPYSGQTDELSFTRLVVDGNILIHPALTDHRNKERMDEKQWATYRENNRFEKQAFINRAMHDLKQNYKDEFQEMIAKRLLEEYKKNK